VREAGEEDDAEVEHELRGSALASELVCCVSTGAHLDDLRRRDDALPRAADLDGSEGVVCVLRSAPSQPGQCQANSRVR
jgi:hypothetical protein